MCLARPRLRGIQPLLAQDGHTLHCYLGWLCRKEALRFSFKVRHCPGPNTSYSARSSQEGPNTSSSSKSSQEKMSLGKQKIAFRNYMDKFCVHMADQLWQEKSFTLRIDYAHLKRENKNLAYNIANSFEESKSTLVAATREFLLEQFLAKDSDGRFSTVEMLEDNIERFTVLHFSSMPKSIMSLEDFLKRHKTTTRHLFRAHRGCKHNVAVLAPAARNVLQKIVAYVTDHHIAGFAWDGKWELSDWEVFDDDCVQLCSSPLKFVAIDMCYNDLEAISSKIIMKLSHDGKATGMFPAYLLDLFKQLKKAVTAGICEADFMGWFYEFLQHHPALMSSKARSTLLKGLYGIAFRLDYDKDLDYRCIFGDTSSVGAWSKFVQKGSRCVHPILWKVFWDKHPPDETTDPTTWSQPYKDTAGQLLKMVRHVEVHSDRATRTYFDGQLMKHNCEAELFVADCYTRFLPEFIKLIFRENKMNGEFATEWAFYKAMKVFVYHELPPEMS